MNLGALAKSAVQQGRATVASVMVDACTITRPSNDGQGAFDPDAGSYDSPAPVVIYSGACRVKWAVREARPYEAGDRQVMETRPTVSIPIGVTNVRVGDVVIVTASALDQALVDQQLRVTDVPKGSLMTARRLVCEVTT